MAHNPTSETEMKAFEAIIQQASKQWLDMLDPRVHVEGLSFKVKPYDLFWVLNGRKVHDRPFTYREYRADLWERRRRTLKWALTRRPLAAKRRLRAAWDALRGRDDGEWY